MTDRIIETDACVVEGMDWLAARCPKMKVAYVLTRPLPLRSKLDGFAELLSAIVGQQVSIASAAAIWWWMKEAGMTTPDACREASEDQLRAIGLSRQKIRYTHELAKADIDFDALRDMPTDRVIKTLVAVPGFGPWTAAVYTMFS
jgi:DNA-3-methyladenine glycosylase II